MKCNADKYHFFLNTKSSTIIQVGNSFIKINNNGSYLVLILIIIPLFTIRSKIFSRIFSNNELKALTQVTPFMTFSHSPNLIAIPWSKCLTVVTTTK